MSRGPGTWQRRILDGVNTGNIVVLTSEGDTRAKQNAIRRAAKQLEAKGLIQLTALKIDGRPRLAAYPPDGTAPQPRKTTGLDGKTYLLPA